MGRQEPESGAAEERPEEEPERDRTAYRIDMDKISRDMLDLRTREKALRERVQADMDDPSSPLSEFLNLIRKGKRQPGVTDRFVHGKRPEFQLQEDGGTQVQQLMRYARTLKDDISRAYESLTYAGWDPADGDPDEMDRAARSAITDNAEDHMLEASPHHPPLGLGHPETRINEVWERRWENVHAKFGRRDLETTPFLLDARYRDENHYRKTGELPEWLDPGVFTQEALTVDPGLRELGYSTMHNTPIDPLDSTLNIERYLKRQMDAHVEGNGKTNLGEHPAEFGRALLRPEMDPLLSEQWHRFDAENFSYTDDGPINYDERHRVEFVTEGNPQDAADPLPDDLCPDAPGRPHDEGDCRRRLHGPARPAGDELREECRSAPENVGIRPPGRRGNLGQTGGNGLRSGGTNPSCGGTGRPERTWRPSRTPPADSPDLGRLKDAVNGLRPQVEAHFDPADLVDHDSPMLNYSFAAMPDDPGDRDVDHPAALLLREAQNDLAQAVNLMDWHRYDETLEEARAAVLAGESPDRVLRALEENGACAEVRHSVEDNLNENGEKLTEEEREKIVMQIMDRLTHADFCITMAHRARAQGA